MGRKLRVMRSVNKEKLKQNSNSSLKNVSKPKKGLNFASKKVGHSESLFIGEKAVIAKKKKKGQKKSGQIKKQKKRKQQSEAFSFPLGTGNKNVVNPRNEFQNFLWMAYVNMETFLVYSYFNSTFEAFKMQADQTPWIMCYC